MITLGASPARRGGRFPIGAASAGAAPSSAIVLTGDVWAFGASSMAGGQIAAASSGGTEDALTNVVRAIEGLAPGSLAYTTVGGSQITRPDIDYNLTGANSARKIRNRGAGGGTSGSGGTIVTKITAAAGSFGANDFILLHQGDNGLSVPGPNVVETLAGGYSAMRTQAGARNYIQIVNTRGGRGSADAANGEPSGTVWSFIKEAAYRVENDLNPGKVFSFHQTLVERATGLDGAELTNLAQGVMPRTFAMNDGSHQIGKGYNLQSDAVLTNVIDAIAGGTPFPLRQIIDVQQPATPAAGDVIGMLVAYGSGGTFALDASNTQSDYAISSSGQITRIGATPPLRDVTWMAVKISKAGRFDKVQPLIGIAERAAPGVSRLVEFDGDCIIGQPDSKLANGSKVTLLFRVQAIEAVLTNVMGAFSTTGLRVQISAAGNIDVLWRNAAVTTVSILSKTSAGALFTPASPARWVAVCIDLSNPAAERTELHTWVDPASATRDVTVLAGANQPGVDTTTNFNVVLNQPWCLGHQTISFSGTPPAFGKSRIGDFTVWNDFVDFDVLANRQAVANADGTPKTAWVSGGGVTDGKTPYMRLAGNAANFRMARITGSGAPATPGASGQYFAFANRTRGAGGVPAFLTTI